MRVALVTQADLFYVPVFFRSFFEQASEHPDISIRAVVELPAFNEPPYRTALRMLRFYGPLDFIRQGSRYVCLKLVDRLRLTPVSVASLCRTHRVPYMKVHDVNGEHFVHWVRTEAIDVLASVAASQIFKRPVLQAPRWGCVNIHSGALPRYRGMMPTFWAMRFGETCAGITIHTMDEQIDRGRILLQDTVEIVPRESLHSLMIRCKQTGAELMWKALEQIKEGCYTLRGYEGPSSYYSFPTPQDVKALRQRGHRLL